MSFVTSKLLESTHGAGFTGGVNRGIRPGLEQGARYIMLLNNDAVGDEHWLKSERFASMLGDHPRIVALIPSFNPDERLTASCKQLMNQVSRIVVVDDGSFKGRSSEILDQCRQLGCTINRRMHNSGIAHALNVGVEVCREGGADFILTLDQDSLVPTDYVRVLLDAWHNASQHNPSVGVIGPDSINSKPVPLNTGRSKLSFGGEPIQSGLFFPIETLNLVGPFNEGFFIDCVDTEYFLRMKDHGLCIALAPGANLMHQLGSKSPAMIFGVQLVRKGKLVELGHCAPFRYYYIRRNRTRLYLKYAIRYPAWALRSVYEETKHHIIVLILLPDRFIHILINLVGLRDGLRDSSGPIPENAIRLTGCAGRKKQRRWRVRMSHKPDNMA